MIQKAIRFLSHGEHQAWDEAEARSVEWMREWDIAQGRKNDKILRNRLGIALPKVPEEKLRTWRQWERKENLAPLIRLKEVTESLVAPSTKGQAEVVKWIDRLVIRKAELKRWTGAAIREKIMENGEERQSWHDRYMKGKTKGLVAGILSKLQGVHTIDNAWGRRGA